MRQIRPGLAPRDLPPRAAAANGLRSAFARSGQPAAPPAEVVDRREEREELAPAPRDGAAPEPAHEEPERKRGAVARPPRPQRIPRTGEAQPIRRGVVLRHGHRRWAGAAASVESARAGADDDAMACCPDAVGEIGVLEIEE